MEKTYKTLGTTFIIIGLLLVIMTPMFRYVIGNPLLVLYLRTTGIIMTAITAGVLLALRKDTKSKIPQWFYFLMVVVLGSMFLANTAIREVTNAINGRGIYSDLTNQNYQK